MANIGSYTLRNLVQQSSSANKLYIRTLLEVRIRNQVPTSTKRHLHRQVCRLDSRPHAHNEHILSCRSKTYATAAKPKRLKGTPVTHSLAEPPYKVPSNEEYTAAVNRNLEQDFQKEFRKSLGWTTAPETPENMAKRHQFRRNLELTYMAARDTLFKRAARDPYIEPAVVTHRRLRECIYLLKLQQARLEQGRLSHTADDTRDASDGLWSRRRRDPPALKVSDSEMEEWRLLLNRSKALLKEIESEVPKEIREQPLRIYRLRAFPVTWHGLLVGIGLGVFTFAILRLLLEDPLPARARASRTADEFARQHQQTHSRSHDDFRDK